MPVAHVKMHDMEEEIVKFSHVMLVVRKNMAHNHMGRVFSTKNPC